MGQIAKCLNASSVIALHLQTFRSKCLREEFQKFSPAKHVLSLIEGPLSSQRIQKFPFHPPLTKREREGFDEA